MKHSDIIRRFLAAFILLLFSFCITPKRFLHDLLANHKDAQTVASSSFEQFSSSGFHCHLDDLVVMAPFLPDIPSDNPVVLFSVARRFTEPVNSFVSLFLSHSDGRGPPPAFCSLI